MKIDQKEFNRKAQHIIDTVVKPQVKRYERAKVIAEAAANLVDPNVCKTENWIAGAKWQQERMYSEEDLRNAYRWGTTVNHGTKEHFNEWFEQFKKKITFKLD